MAWWQALILGLVEGVTEYLPVSSTGHLILTSWILGLTDGKVPNEAVNTYSIVIQAGAIIAVLGLYRARVKQMCSGLLGRDLPGRRLAINLMIAFVPAAMLGPLFDDSIDHYLMKPWPVTGALFVGAILMLAVARWQTQKSGQLTNDGSVDSAGDISGKIPGEIPGEIQSVTWQMALLIGLAQCLAMWPGTSRSMVTIVAAMMLGLRPRAAAEFSFLLGLITLTAATGYKCVFGGDEMVEQIGLTNIAIGLVAATVAAGLAVKWFVSFLVEKGLAPFGWYRLGLAGICAVFILWV